MTLRNKIIILYSLHIIVCFVSVSSILLACGYCLGLVSEKVVLYGICWSIIVLKVNSISTDRSDCKLVKMENKLLGTDDGSFLIRLMTGKLRLPKTLDRTDDRKSRF